MQLMYAIGGGRERGLDAWEGFLGGIMRVLEHDQPLQEEAFYDLDSIWNLQGTKHNEAIWIHGDWWCWAYVQLRFLWSKHVHGTNCYFLFSNFTLPISPSHNSPLHLQEWNEEIFACSPDYPFPIFNHWVTNGKIAESAKSPPSILNHRELY